MKTFYFVLLLSLLPFFAIAQKLSKEEERALKNELKKMSPEQFRALKEENNDLAEEIKKQEKKVFEQTNTVNDLQMQIQNKDIQLEQLKKDLSQVGKKLTTPAETNDFKVTKGALFRVQIGAYQNKKLAKILSKQKSFDIEDGENDMKRYLVGSFTKYHEAKSFCEKLIRNGAQAFVVGYLDGVRINNLKEMPLQHIN